MFQVLIYIKENFENLTTKALQKLAKDTLSEKRYKHEKNVAKKAKELAKIYHVDIEKTEKSAWIHDILKEKDKNVLLQLLSQDAIIAKTNLQQPASIWHGPAASIYAKEELGITDDDILSAVACHTTGKENMSMLDKVLYVADAISEERSYDGVEQLRELANINLDEAVFTIMQQTVNYLQKANKPIDPESIKALHYMQQQLNSNGGMVLE